MSWLDRMRGSLVFRIYLMGLAHMALVAFGFIAFAELTARDFAKQAAAEDAFAVALAPLLTDPAAVQRELERALDGLESSMTVTGPPTAVLSTEQPAHCACLH